MAVLYLLLIFGVSCISHLIYSNSGARIPKIEPGLTSIGFKFLARPTQVGKRMIVYLTSAKGSTTLMKIWNQLYFFFKERKKKKKKKSSSSLDIVHVQLLLGYMKMWDFKVGIWGSFKQLTPIWQVSVDFLEVDYKSNFFRRLRVKGGNPSIIFEVPMI